VNKHSGIDVITRVWFHPYSFFEAK